MRWHSIIIHCKPIVKSLFIRFWAKHPISCPGTQVPFTDVTGFIARCFQHFSYGDFTLDAFLNFSVGNDVVNASNAFLMSSTGQLNERTEVLNRWTPENTNTDVPRANANRRTLLYSTLVEDRSFLRLQALTLGYQIPEQFLRGARSGRVYVTGQNLFTITDYSGFDPEVNSLNGSPSARGLDVGAYPRSRIWNFGVSITF